MLRLTVQPGRSGNTSGDSFAFTISAAAYQNLARTTNYRWPSQERLGRAPALQFTGPGAETVTLDGTIYPGFRAGLDQLVHMRSLAAKGVPVHVTDAIGADWGLFVITTVTEKQSVFFNDGAPRKQEFTLSLARYGDDEPGSEAAAP